MEPHQRVMCCKGQTDEKKQMQLKQPKASAISAPMYSKDCKGCWWTIHAPAGDGLPSLRYCGHPQHTARATHPCPHYRDAKAEGQRMVESAAL